MFRYMHVCAHIGIGIRVHTHSCMLPHYTWSHLEIFLKSLVSVCRDPKSRIVIGLLLVSLPLLTLLLPKT